MNKYLVRWGIVAMLLAAGGASADVITDWNKLTLDIIRAERLPPPPATRLLAMVHTAMFDAVNSVERQYEFYDDGFRFQRGASATPAAAWAAYSVLIERYPSRARELRELLSRSLSAGPRGLPQVDSRILGRDCARRILALRAGDHSGSAVSYSPSGAPGSWEPTPPAFAPALLPQWPYVLPWTMSHGAQFRAPLPPSFDSSEFADAYREVLDYGRATGSLRTADQTQIAYFWEDGAGTVTPPGHWQVIAQQLAAQFGNTLIENARLFALLSLAQADAAIVSWDSKYHYDHLRPYTAITRFADEDGNPQTEIDPGWSPLIPTPPFPSYTSGHSTFSGSSSKILELFFGTDRIAFSAPSPDPQRWPLVLPGVVRSWSSLSQAAEEAGQSRIYGGIHWQYDNRAGLDAGRALAIHVFDNFLRPRRDAGQAQHSLRAR